MDKRLILVILLVMTFIGYTLSNNEKRISNGCHIEGVMVDNNDWTLLGEISLSGYYQSSETIVAKLYVMEIGNGLVYRVEYKGNYYVTSWNESSKTYFVTIEGKNYRCDVPSVSNGNNSKKYSPNNSFQGIWKPQEIDGFFSAMSISETDGGILVKIKWLSDIYTDTNVQVNDKTISGGFLVSTEDGSWKISYTGGRTCKILEKERGGWRKVADIPWKGYPNELATTCKEWIHFRGELKNGDMILHFWTTYSYCGRWGQLFYYDCCNFYYTCTTW